MNGDDLRRWREILRISQAELARQLGVSVAAVWRWEHDQRDAPGEMLEMALVQVVSRLSMDFINWYLDPATTDLDDIRSNLREVPDVSWPVVYTHLSVGLHDQRMGLNPFIGNRTTTGVLPTWTVPSDPTALAQLTESIEVNRAREDILHEERLRRLSHSVP